MDIIIDKQKLDKYVEVLKPVLKKCNYDIFYLEETIPFKHWATGEEGTVTNLPFMFKDGDYHIIYAIETTPDGEWKSDIDGFLEHITHVNINPRGFAYYAHADNCCYKIYYHHFCNSLNHTLSSQHFTNIGLIKATLSYNIRQQNPSDAYFRSEDYLKLFSKEKTLKCSKCGGVISPNANPLERLFGTHLSCIDNIDNYINDNTVSDYYYEGSYYARSSGCLPDDTNSTYKNITKEEIEEALKNMIIDVDYTMVGCGSAGSNIGFQLAKTDMLKRGVLYDDDVIESKNLRNTTYLTFQNYKDKVTSLAKQMLDCRLDVSRTVKSLRHKYNINGNIYNSRYIFNLVDSLVTRLKIAENAKYRYIVDTRFKGLNCSVYIVDKEDEQQYKYYIDGLKQSVKDYVEDVRVPKEYITPEMAYRIQSIRRGVWECASKLRKRSEKFYRELPLDQKESLLQLLDESRRTCSSPNIIDIYTIVAGVVVSAIRNIENGKSKPFTHLEMSTEDGLLKQMVVM